MQVRQRATTRRGSRSRWLVAGLVVLALVATACNSDGGGDSDEAEDTDSAVDKVVGVGTPEALANPTCDPSTGLVKVPSLFAAPCVKPWADGSDNGGATSPGVTATSIRVGVLQCAPSDAKCFADLGALGAQITGTDTCAQDVSMWRPFNQFYEFWGRQIEVVCLNSHGFDEAAQRADALDAASKNLFMVISLQAGGLVFDTEIAKRGIISFTARTPWDAPEEQEPFRWGGTDDRLGMLATAEVVCNSLAKKPANWAGDPAMQAQTRKFGVVYPKDATFAPISTLLDALDKCGVTPVVQVDYSLGPKATVIGDPTAAQEQAPLAVAKLKEAGANNVLMFADPSMTGAMSTQATSQGYSPEWFVTDFKYQTALSFSFDQQQWNHAFGLYNPILTNVADSATAPKITRPDHSTYWWYYGEKGDTTSNCGSGKTCDGTNGVVIPAIAAGLAISGPRLTPDTFKAAMFSLPPVCPKARGCLSRPQYSFGTRGFVPWDDYSGPESYGLAWYDPAGRTCFEGTSTCLTGGYMAIEGVHNFILGQFPKGDLAFFDRSKSQAGLPTRPPQDIPPTYPCTGCPSSS
jgi:hypothetical protein